MSAQTAKDIRKQVRNVFQEHLKTEAGKQIGEDLRGHLNARLDEIEKVVTSQLTAMDARARSVQGFLVQVVKNEVQTKLDEAEDARDALIKLLAESGLQIPNLEERLKEEAAAIRKAKIEKASAELSAKLEADKQAATQETAAPAENATA